jgi:flagellar assembly protein FliH
MLCKVLDEADVEITAAPWRHTKPKAHSPAPQKAVEHHAGHTHEKTHELSTQQEQRIKEAWDQGYRAGEDAARKNLEGQTRAALETLAATIADVSSTRSNVIRNAEADTVRLALEIARRVLHREVSLDGSALEALMKAAIAKLQNQEIYRVRVHPDQERMMRACLTQANRGSSVEIVADPAQSRGGVSFEISRGTLDASIDTQLREIENGLVDQLRSRA